jgi:peptidoglycan/LPS O-acetylase OafA/YrhL
MVSIGKRLDESNGIGAGFDSLRISLAIWVVAWHSPAISRNALQLDESYFWFFGYSILFAFFALSGFLISASALRLSLKNFLINRGLRILPALAVEILLTAFVLGAIFTTLDLKSYFSDPRTYHYLTNLFGWMNYWLPGVFETNPVTLLNISLWTVPFEMGCYAIMSGLIIFGLLKRPAIIATFTATYMVVGLVIKSSDVQLSGLALEASRIAVGRGSRLFVAFVFGILLYLLRYRIPYTSLLIALCVTFCLGIAIFVKPGESFPVLNAVLAIPLAYLTICIGVTRIPLPQILHRNDLSYGVYLYGMPIQQTMIYLFPSVVSPIAQFIISLPAILLFALFSWNVIEKPVTKLRKRFSFVATIRGVDENPETEIEYQIDHGHTTGPMTLAKGTRR